MHVDIRQAAKSTAVCGAMTHHVASAFVKAHIVSGRALQLNARKNLQTQSQNQHRCSLMDGCPEP